MSSFFSVFILLSRLFDIYDVRDLASIFWHAAEIFGFRYQKAEPARRTIAVRGVLNMKTSSID